MTRLETQAIRLLQSGEPCTAVVKATGLPMARVSAWHKEHAPPKQRQSRAKPRPTEPQLSARDELLLNEAWRMLNRGVSRRVVWGNFADVLGEHWT